MVIPIRGEVWICQLVKDYGKTRPCIVVQSAEIESGSVLMVPLTDGNLMPWRVAIPPDNENGLLEAGRDRKPVAMTEKVQPVHPKRMRVRIGLLSTSLLAELDEKLCAVLALRRPGGLQ